MKVNLKKFKENVLYLLKEKNFSVQKICEQANLGKNMIYDLDLHLPSLENAIKISKALDISLDYLVGRTENQDKLKSISAKNFYKNLNIILKENKIIKTKFYKDMNYSTDCFTRWKKGSIPYLSTIIEIADYLNCSIDDLLEE